MNVVLLERVEHLGQVGDVVAVKPGYARNFLLPQGKALRASKENLVVFEQRKADLQKAADAKKADAEKVAKTLEGKSFVMVRQAAETGQLYGSASNRDIADLLNDKGHNVARNQVRMQKPIKTIGLFDVPVVLNPDVIIDIKLNVARSEEEAEIQAKTGKAIITEEEKPAPAPVAEAAETEAQDVSEETVEAEVAETKDGEEAA